MIFPSKSGLLAIGGILAAAGLLFQSVAIDRLKDRNAALVANLELSRKLRASEQVGYARAQETARLMEQARIDAAVAKQKETSHAALASYEARVRVLDGTLDGLRAEVRRAAAAAGPAGGGALPALAGATGGTDAAPEPAYAPCDRDCLVSLIRYDELITWVEASLIASD